MKLCFDAGYKVHKNVIKQDSFRKYIDNDMESMLNHIGILRKANRELEDIIKMKPQNRNEFSKISGVDPFKIENYADLFLEEIL